MHFTESRLAGAYLIEPERFEDERGFFARTFSETEFGTRGLRTSFPQCSVSFNARAGTLRGMHFQADPHGEAKLIRCTMGAVLDIIVDVRSDSTTYLQWAAFELSAENRLALYVPEGFAHGFQTLVDRSELFYQISTVYEPAAARGLRWDDPAVGIDWPPVEGQRILSDRDRTLPDWTP